RSPRASSSRSEVTARRRPRRALLQALGRDLRAADLEGAPAALPLRRPAGEAGVDAEDDLAAFEGHDAVGADEARQGGAAEHLVVLRAEAARPVRIRAARDGAATVLGGRLV